MRVTFSTTPLKCCSVGFKDLGLSRGQGQGQGLEAQGRGQGLVNWFSRTRTGQGQQHWVTVKNGLLADICQYAIYDISK